MKMKKKKKMHFSPWDRKKMHFSPWDRKKKMLKMHLSACHSKKKKKHTLISTPASWRLSRCSARRRWSILPKNVLFDILDRLTDIDDYVRFGAVCVSWRSVLTQDKNSYNKKKMLKMNLSACHSKKKKKDTRISTTASWLSPCSAQRDWSMLPKNVLFDILDRLTDIDDYVRFGAVCPSWRSVLTEDKNSYDKKRHCSQPFLLIGYPSSADHRMVMFSLSRGKIYNFDLHLPDDNYFCRGSSFGWLVTLHVQDMNNYFRVVNQSPYRHILPDTNKYSVQLQNPFLPHDRIIHLPGLDSMIQQHPFYENELPVRELYLLKAVLSSDPLSSDNFSVLAIMSGFCGLAFFKSGSKDWTSIGQWRGEWEESRWFKDVMFSEKTKQFYALRSDYEVLIIDFLEGGEPNIQQLMPPIKLKLGMCDPLRMYLVEDLSTGELLQVHKYYRYGPVTSLFFVLFKLDPLKRSWVRMQNLADKVMFLGNNNSIVRSASDCPGCEPNCVYFTDDKRCYPCKRGCEPPYDGIYNFEDDAVQPHCVFPPCGHKETDHETKSQIMVRHLNRLQQ